MGGYVVIGGLLLVIGIYILSYYLNGKTEAPAGINPIECESCHSLSCSMRGKKQEITSEECAINQLD